ncbi:hypothetical protein M3J09_002070 [Ascochyta lentis]
MSSLKTSIEINAPPERVRMKFLDFANLPTYHTSCFTSLTPNKPGEELQKNDTVQVVMANGTKFTGVVQQNTPLLFSWTGSIPYVFTGTHSFSFTPSTVTAGATTFSQEEKFSGALGWWLMGDGALGRGVGIKEKTRVAWRGFDEDLKRVCEGGVKAGE